IQDSSEFSFGLQYYGTSLGYMVTMLDGTYDEPVQPGQPGQYWKFVLNGKDAQQGVDYTTLSPGDTIGFVYEPYDAEKHRDTHMEIKHQYYLALRARRIP